MRQPSVLSRCEVAAQARLDPVFDAMGQRTMWVGPAGFGSRLPGAAKIVDEVAGQPQLGIGDHDQVHPSVGGRGRVDQR